MKVNSSPQRSSSKLARDAPAAENEEAVDVVARDDVNNGRYNTPPEQTEIATYHQREGGTLSAASRDGNGLTQLDRIERMMMELKADNERLEANTTELKADNERLEAKVSSLESNYELGTQSLKDHIDALLSKCLDLAVSNDKLFEWIQENLGKAGKLHEYNAMVLQNQKWEYPAFVDDDDSYDGDEFSEDYWLNEGYTNDEASTMAFFATRLKEKTIELRHGVIPEVCPLEDWASIDVGCSNEMDTTAAVFTSHWKEFADALKQYTPALNLLDCRVKEFRLHNALSEAVQNYISDVLINTPFTHMDFWREVDPDVEPIFRCVLTLKHIMDVAESNRNVRSLHFTIDTIKFDEIDRFCAIASNLEELIFDIYGTIDPVIGNAFLTSLFSRDDLKLKYLWTPDVGKISSETIIVLGTFLASNPRLIDLHLCDNKLYDRDVAVIVNGLRSNTTLERLSLQSDYITDHGLDVYARLLCDESSLNAVADSNHRLLSHSHVGGRTRNENHLLQRRHQNHSKTMAENRAAKIYLLLRSRHFSSEVMSNAELFNDIDVEMLPYALEALQKYAKVVDDLKDFDRNRLVYVLERENLGCLSIIYDIMRNWDTALHWYESTGTGSALAS